MKIDDTVKCPYCGEEHHDFYVDESGNAEIECIDLPEYGIKGCGNTFKVKAKITYVLEVSK